MRVLSVVTIGIGSSASSSGTQRALRCIDATRRSFRMSRVTVTVVEHQMNLKKDVIGKNWSIWMINSQYADKEEGQLR